MVGTKRGGAPRYRACYSMILLAKLGSTDTLLQHHGVVVNIVNTRLFKYHRGPGVSSIIHPYPLPP